MNQQKPQTSYFSSSIVFAAWFLLRFILSSWLRSFVFEKNSWTSSEKILISHGLIVLEAVLLLLVYVFFWRQNKVKEIHFQMPCQGALRIVGIAVLVIGLLTIPIVFHFDMKFFFQISYSSIAGNLFSNAAEEIIYRGILLGAVLALTRSSWIGIVVSSVAFGIGHWDLPILFQAYIAVVGCVFGWSYIKTQSLWTPYVIHTIADILLDLFIH